MTDKLPTGAKRDGEPLSATGPADPAPTPPPAREGESERRTVTRPAPPLERRRHGVSWRTGDVLRAAALVIGLYLLLRLLWVASALVFVVFLAVLFGLAVEAGVDRLERWRIPRGIGALLIVASFFAALVLSGILMAPTLQTQSRELRRRLPQAIDKVQVWFEERRSGMLGLLITDDSTPPAAGAGEDEPRRPVDTLLRVDTMVMSVEGGDTTIRPVSTRREDEETSPPGILPGQDSVELGEPPGITDAEAGRDTAAADDGSLRQRLETQVSGLSQYLFRFLTSTLAVVSGILLITFLTIFIAADPDTYHRGMMHLFPHRMRPKAGQVLSATAAVLRRWLITQLIGMVTIGVVTTIVLLILDVRAAFALGVIAGLLEFVPTIGPIISAVPAIAMGFLDSPQKALWVLIAYVVIQQLESNVLIPILMKEGVDLPPAVTLVAQALMALIFGFLGLLVAVPLVAAIMVPVKLLYVEGVVGDDIELFESSGDE